MRKAGIPVIAFLFLAALLIFAQSYKGQGRIIGVVTDQEGIPLAGVKVKLYSQKGGAGFEEVTDSKGEWKANYVRGGGWNIDFEKAGYVTRKISTTIMENFKNPPISIQLQKAEGLLNSEELKSGLNEGNRLYEEKKYEAAASVYERILAKNPEAYIINKNIGNCYFELQQYDKAEGIYRKVLDKDPGNAEIMMLIGNCYANRGDNDKAMDWYNRIEFEKITDPMVLFNIGSKFYNQSKFEEALKYYQRSVEVKRDFLDGIYQLGLTDVALQNNAEAVKIFENYLKLDPDSPRAAQVRGFLDYLKKKLDRSWRTRRAKDLRA